VTKNSEQTKQDILDAVGRMLARQGFQGIGVNALAREAGVDKVLIYRYFGGLDKLLEEYAKQGGFWPSIGTLLGRPAHSFETLSEMTEAILKGHLRELRQRPVTQEIMRWELHERNELTAELARFRETQGLEIMDLMPQTDKTDDEIDLAAMGAIIHAGLTYLILRAKTADVYLGVDLTDDDGWQRVENAISSLLTVLKK